MGTIRNEMTIVHHYDKNELEKVREDAVNFFEEVAREDLGLRTDVANFMISPIMQSYINREYTFVINGDCSKVGWETSERFHDARIKWCEKHKHDVENIIVINFGEGDEPCRIVFDSQAGIGTEGMEDIELVIKISKESYIATCNGSMLPPDVKNVVNAIKNGTPIDLEGLKSDMKALNCGYPYGLDYLLDCLDKRLGITIAGADKESEK